MCDHFIAPDLAHLKFRPSKSRDQRKTGKFHVSPDKNWKTFRALFQMLMLFSIERSTRKRILGNVPSRFKSEANAFLTLSEAPAAEYQERTIQNLSKSNAFLKIERNIRNRKTRNVPSRFTSEAKAFLKLSEASETENQELIIIIFISKH